MGTFELGSAIAPTVSGMPAIRTEGEGLSVRIGEHGEHDENVIAFKIYDSCRQKYCLGPRELGPARAAECFCFGEKCFEEGDVILAPPNAANVAIDGVKVKKSCVISKQPSPFKTGCWDVDLQYVFEYALTFREANGNVITPSGVKANGTFNKRVTLFGSIDTGVRLSTDFIPGDGTFDSDPFVLSESKAVPLSAEINYGGHHHCCEDKEDGDKGDILVTIGLFTLVNLFRVVHLTLEGKGFVMPKECPELSPLSPCEFFGALDFPTEVFAPPETTCDKC